MFKKVTFIKNKILGGKKHNVKIHFFSLFALKYKRTKARENVA